MGNDFARQLAERNAEVNGQGTKKFRSSVAPKGSKLASGYQDRTQLRSGEDEDEKSSRVKALEDMVKLGQIDESTFKKLRDEIVGGSVKDVHLVKGLDFNLLGRVRRGEDVFSDEKKPELMQGEEQTKDTDEVEEEVNVDEELEKLEGKVVKPITKDERPSKANLAPPSLAGKKRTRDEILRELKASRSAAADAKKARQHQLGPGFKKIGLNKDQPRIEKDWKGREVLITVDADGNVKRKVRRAERDRDGNKGLLIPDKDAVPLGMDVPTGANLDSEDVEEDGDIFQDVGKDYDPLADIQEDSCSSGLESENEDAAEFRDRAHDTVPRSKSPILPASSPLVKEDSTIPPQPGQGSRSRTYFNDAFEDPSLKHTSTSRVLDDPTIRAALKKASTINPLAHPASADQTDEDLAKMARRKKMLDAHDRDADDLDLGFGSSRLGDDEDAEADGKKVKLSTWGDQSDREGGGGAREGSKRKRGLKKKKGDKDSAGDVMRVLEGRKGKVDGK